MMAMTMTGSTLLSQGCGRFPACRQSNSSPLCSASLRSLSCKSTFRGGNVAQYSRVHQRSTQQRRGGSLIVRAGLGDVGKYLSEAAAAVFSPTKEDVPWSGGNFTGKVSHHEGDVPRLRRLYKAVRETRQQLSGCMDPNAANYDPNAVSDSGTCTYLYEDPQTGKKTEGELRDFVTTTLGSLFGNKSDNSGPNWEGTGYAYSGDKVSQRDIERLLRYENVVKQTLDKAEADAK
ncbi:hypothetical protein ABBQ32_004227 [Trebouxia sp. C0010 RCD-2024]